MHQVIAGTGKVCDGKTSQRVGLCRVNNRNPSRRIMHVLSPSGSDSIQSSSQKLRGKSLGAALEGSQWRLWNIFENWSAFLARWSSDWKYEGMEDQDAKSHWIQRWEGEYQWCSGLHCRWQVSKLTFMYNVSYWSFQLQSVQPSVCVSCPVSWSSCPAYTEEERNTSLQPYFHPYLRSRAEEERETSG